VALALDGRPLGDVAHELRQQELDLSEEQLSAFAEQLEALGFLEEEGTPPEGTATPAEEPDQDADQDADQSAHESSNDDGRIFGPLAQDESGYFSGPKIGDRAGDDAKAAGTGDQPAGGDDLPAAAAPRPGKTPAPLSLQAAAARRASGTPAPETVGPGGLRVDRTLTSFPPELLPKDWLSTPAPDLLPAPGRAEQNGEQDAAEQSDLPQARPEKNGTPAPVSLGASGPVPTAASGKAEITAKMDLPAAGPAASPATKTPTPAPARAREGTPPPIPLAALAKTPPPVAPVTHEPFNLDPADDALTAERPVIAFPDMDLPPELDDLPALLPEAAAAPSAPEPAAPAVPVAATGAAAPPPPSEADTPPASSPHVELSESRERPTRELHAVPNDPTAAPPAAVPLPAPGQAAALEAPYADDLGDAPPAGRKTWFAYAALGIAAAFVISAMIYKYIDSSEPPPIAVRTMVPAPTTVYRFWDATAKTELAKASPFGIPADGKIAEVIAEGSKFAGGDILALLESGQKFRQEHTRAAERLAYYEGQLAKMTAENNKPEARQAELKIAEKKRLMSEAQMKMAEHALVATEPGEAAEVLVKVGDTVKAGAPILRTKGSTFRAVFELPRDKADKARQLGFCRAELIDQPGGKPLDCSLSAEGGDETHVAIDLPPDPAVAEGKAVRLARDKLDAVFTVPASSLSRVGESDRLFVIGPSGRAELRVVSVAERSPTEAIITQGIDVGDQVIVDAPPTLRHDTRVLVTGKAP
jgi:multidrug efflux pump subunit AcrA (membrane-fusion protein)